MTEEEGQRAPWETGQPSPWVLKVFGGPPKGAYAWLSKIVLALAAISLGAFSVTRLLLIHWVFLVPASLGSLLALGLVYIVLEKRRTPVLILHFRDEVLTLVRPGLSERKVPLGSVAIDDRPSEHRFDLRHLPDGEVLCSLARDSVRDVSLYETVRRYLSLPAPSRPSLPPQGPPRPKFYRWFILTWGVIILVMILWALYENYAAPRSYEPFSNP